MKKKKLLSLVIAGVVAISALTACASTSNAQKATEAAKETAAESSTEATKKLADATEESPETSAAEDTTTGAKPIRIYLVRHGQTYSNIKEATIGGGGNAQLTEKGRQYAYSLGLGFDKENIKFDAAYSSTLGRAYETANQILRGDGQDMDVVQYDNLKDISWGSVEGGRIEDLEKDYGIDGNDFVSYFGTYDQTDFVSPVEGAEPTHQFSERIDAALRDIVAENEATGGNILVVGHSSLGFYLHKYRADQDMAGLTNTSTSILEYKDGEFSLVDYDNVEFLEDGIEIRENFKPLEIKLVTTPQTIFKTADVLEGTSDSDLNENGVRQAEQLKDVLGESSVGAVYSSNLNRSRRTADIALDGMNLEPVESENLNELFLGFWEAEHKEVLEETEKENLDKLFSAKDILNFAAPDGDGENPAVAAYRLKNTLQDIGVVHQADENTIVVFTHPHILTAYLNAEFPEYDVEVSDDMQIVTLEYASEIFTVTGSETVAGK